MTIKLLNFTPHEINLIMRNEKINKFPSKGIARVTTLEKQDEEIKEIDSDYSDVFVNVEYGKIEGLPLDDSQGIFFIVSSFVKSADPTRSSLIVPHDLVRDKDGRVIGCRQFRR